MTELTETLELKLVELNAHKHRKLCETKQAYQDALKAAFNANCTTQTEANDVVVNYDLSGYAKNALKKYVPQLCGDSYNADELHNDHPVRFTNEGPKLDHQPQNALEWYVKIPHHEDYHLWIPVQINPNQREWLEALYADDAEMGECRLIERDGTWYFHVTATRDVEEQSQASVDERTPIGVDIGEASLVTVCHRDESGSPVRPELWANDGKAVRRLRKTYFTAKRRLQKRGSERIAESYGDTLWSQIDNLFHRVTREVIEYAESVENPVLVLEDLTYIRENMDYGKYMNRRLHGWGFAKLHAQIRYKAAEKGIPVETVNPRNTSKACHACGEHGSRPRQATFRCSNDDCWLGEYQADVNGAINIADRYRSGESHRRSDRASRQKAGDDDSATDGASLTGPQDSHADAETQQKTCGPYAS
ncbi:IS1341-type transposase ISNma12 (plasmid) [Natrialba magadii ATCC 43099]|uniref:IS1341-type transposase ISNma12 n=1 Tax=Natrialba magadii (strain ATCC 43099 / DSM 3394 / CCM 3739 / CIP 104546 / IAM 13178 / JCM 8861 / NBRC 102185 / NCIMB 2190 / MS3) TaxID=547559 RepID=D3T216_NATMM|nr:RNA-guided endonuclease TnpB family protein [Natrialba magadii]ADD07625.1 IS1341-type transposase ISNma12 [Natrialba magadii ATCC 43099]ELY27102.1 transposase, IS605 OrfB family protein [Natrialba magadii ATCC 43099]